MLSARRLLFANAAAAKLSRGLTVTRTRSSLTDARYKLLCSGEGWRQHHSSLANPVLESNEASCIDRDVPAVIRGYATRWPAIKRWRNADYICEHSSWGFCDGSPGGGAIEVEVEFSNTGVFPSNGTERMTTKTLFDRLAASDRAGQHCADIYAANLSVGLLDGHGYGTTLLNDLKPLPPFNLFRSSHRGSKDAEPDPNVWIGRGSTTALHWDDQDNWIVQVCGVNEVRLYSRIHSDQIYPKSDSNQSHVVGIEPLEVLSEEKKAHVESQWPGFTNVPYEIVVCVSALHGDRGAHITGLSG
eukprot:SAG31_NODE_2317_length_5947_cov_2.753591_5_plen_301_part_00